MDSWQATWTRVYNVLGIVDIRIDIRGDTSKRYSCSVECGIDKCNDSK